MSNAMRSGWDELNDAGRTLSAQGDNAGAEEAFRAALTEAEQGDGAPSRLATSLETLAHLKYRKQDRTAAEALFRCALALRDESADPTDESTLSTLDSLAELYVARGAYDEAEALLVRALAAVDGPAADPDVLGARLNALAQFHIERGRHAAAEPLLLRLLAVKQELRPNDPEIAPILTNLATVQSALGRHRYAEQLLRQALAVTGADGLLRKLSEEVAAQGQASGPVASLEQPVPFVPHAEPALPAAEIVPDGLSAVHADEQPRAEEAVGEAVDVPPSDSNPGNRGLPAWWTELASSSPSAPTSSWLAAAQPAVIQDAVPSPEGVAPTAEGVRLFAAAAAMALGTFEPAPAPTPQRVPREVPAPATLPVPVAPPAPRNPTPVERLFEPALEPAIPSEGSLTLGPAWSAPQPSHVAPPIERLDPSAFAKPVVVPRRRVASLPRIAAAAAIVAAVLVAGRLVVNSRTGSDNSAAVAGAAKLGEGKGSAARNSVLTASAGSVGRVPRSGGRRAMARSGGATTASSREQAAGTARNRKSDGSRRESAGSRLPRPPVEAVKIDMEAWRVIEDNLAAQAESPALAVPAITPPDGPLPQADSRHANGVARPR